MCPSSSNIRASHSHSLDLCVVNAELSLENDNLEWPAGVCEALATDSNGFDILQRIPRADRSDAMGH